MQLSQSFCPQISSNQVEVPQEHLFRLPEKVLQFGTGVLLRGLPDYFIDKANKQGLFNGRVVVVKSTAKGDTDVFHQQDGLFTLCVRGVQNGQTVSENSINAAISRVLNSATEWAGVLRCAHNPELQIIISNTTEVGIQLTNDDITLAPPRSFPGKLLAFLYERFQVFGGSAESGMVIVPTELVPDNGRQLRGIVLELARQNGLPASFSQWLEEHNRFCSSLVDRIVPGLPDASRKAELEQELGYTDELLTMAEVYRLWAVEGDEQVREVLAFAAADSGMIVTPNIEKYRELKLRLLNGAHTFSCGLAFLAGFETVTEAMAHPAFAGYLQELMQQEIAPAIPCNLSSDEALRFAEQVLDRFRNPHIRHPWINITMQYSAKMNMRCVPLLRTHYQRFGSTPKLMALGFAAYLAFSRPVGQESEKFFGKQNGAAYPVADDRAEVMYRQWQQPEPAALVQRILSDAGFWGCDLSGLPGFADAVTYCLERILQQGALETLEQYRSNEPVHPEAIV